MSLSAEADFDLSLLKIGTLNQTTVLSPISVALALSLVHLGARRNSKEQIKNVLCKGFEHNDCTHYFSSLQTSLAQKDHPYLKNWMYCSKPGNITCVPENLRQYYKAEDVPADFPLQNTGVLMNIANRVFASNEVKVKLSYQDQLASEYNATLQNLDFSNPSKTEEIVNKFVKMETAGKIDKLVGPDSFDNGKLALLVNAVYFHGRWAETFKTFLSKQEKFYEKEGVSKEIAFMKHVKKIFPFFENDDFISLGLPYKNRKYRLTILLPKRRFGLAAALKKLNGESLQELITNSQVKTLNVTLPKFKIEAEMKMQNVLQEMGVIDPFTEKADLSGITDVPARLGSVIHKANIDVNEKGTTAAASTAIELIPVSAFTSFEEPISFVADHPFLFVLSMDGHILFTGQYYG